MKNGLPPLIWPDCRALILGSLPGEQSLERKEYYANPRNQFWKIISAVYDEAIPIDYIDRTVFLRTKKIGLWDIAARARRSGSADSAIGSAVANNFVDLLRAHNELRLIAFNGALARNLFETDVLPKVEGLVEKVVLLGLPSSSAAYPQRFALKVNAWTQIQKAAPCVNPIL